MNFFISHIKNLMEDGHTVDMATNEKIASVPSCYLDWGCRVYPLSCTRTPMNKGTLTAIGEIKKIVEEGKYDIVHCHTPVASICARLACRRARKKDGLKVMYTVHGFHFFHGAPLKNWLLYYSAEKLCSRYTDVLITINQEDYALAKRQMKAKKVCYVPGVGIDLSRFRNVEVDRSEKRRELGIPEDAFLLLSVGELNENKNHQVIIRAMAEWNNTRVHYAIAGIGDKKKELLDLASELGVGERVHLLGFRTDVPQLNYVSDAFCFPSRREGLGLAAIEAMACGLPVLTSNVHGINDYSIDGVTGYKCAPDDVSTFAENIQRLMHDTSAVATMSRYNMELVQKYDVLCVGKLMNDIYKDIQI